MSNGCSILVAGARGMLAGHLIPLLERNGFRLLLTDLRPGGIHDYRSADFPLPPCSPSLQVAQLDITNLEQTLKFVAEHKPEWIINCAAYTAVDDAEVNREVAFAVNSIGPANLARAAAASGAKLLHFSSDYLFCEEPRQRTPWTEDSLPSPRGIYAHSKRFGDELICAILPTRHLILRTSWLHGLYGPNFLRTIYNAAKQRPELRVVNDQFGSPTWAEWLASVVFKMIRKDASGLFNACSRGGITWFDFAQGIVEEAGLSTKVLPQTTAEINRPAPRPLYSVLSTAKLEQFLGEDCISWSVGVSEHLQFLKKFEGN